MVFRRYRITEKMHVILFSWRACRLCSHDPQHVMLHVLVTFQMASFKMRLGLHVNLKFTSLNLQKQIYEILLINCFVLPYYICFLQLIKSRSSGDLSLPWQWQSFILLLLSLWTRRHGCQSQFIANQNFQSAMSRCKWMVPFMRHPRNLESISWFLSIKITL